MKTITTNVYTFNELSESAKQKAREWWMQGGLDYEWWDSVYEDAERVGIKIESFDLDRSRHAKGKLTLAAPEVAENIIKEHGVDCETYKTARAYLNAMEAIGEAPMVEEDGELVLDEEDTPERLEWEEKREALDEQFEKDILEDYSIMLQKEYEYLCSDEHIDESIEANEYTFTEQGKRFG